MKAVIVAAGYGTRLLPFTKTVPKELAPLVDRPAIAFVVDELITAGVKDLLVIGSRRKKALEDWFDREIELEQVFHEEQKASLLELIKPADLNVQFIRQAEMRGTGHALLLVEKFAADGPLLVAYPDDLFMGEGLNPCQQLTAVHQQTGASVLAVQDLSGQDVSRYGVIEPLDLGPPIRVKQLVEKPDIGKEPSHLISLGRYLLTPDIFPLLRDGWARHGSGEFYHIGALNQLGSLGRLAAVSICQQRLDVGDRLGYMEAFCRYAMHNPQLSPTFVNIIRQLLDESDRQKVV